MYFFFLAGCMRVVSGEIPWYCLESTWESLCVKGLRLLENEVDVWHCYEHP